MSILDLSEVPNLVAMQLSGNTGIFQSPLNGSIQTLDRGGLRWEAQYTFSKLRGDARANLIGTLAGLRAQANRLRVPVYDNAKRGLYGGTPTVDGASQTGNSINLADLSNNITDWIRKGDYFSIDVNGEHELKMATADASSNGTGLITVSFEPRLRTSPLDNAVVYVEDDVLPKPRGIFILTDPNALWSSRPGSPSHISVVSLAMTEDLFATQ